MDESLIGEETLVDVPFLVEFSALCDPLVGLSTFKYTGIIGTEIKN